MNSDDKSRIRGDGLRYLSKAGGTPYAGPAAGTMSCLLCGRHMPRSLLEVFTAAGTRQMRCRGGCAKQEGRTA
jgi:hypothetical protein